MNDMGMKLADREWRMKMFEPDHRGDPDHSPDHGPDHRTADPDHAVVHGDDH